MSEPVLRFRATSRVVPEIGLTPLIDILFIVLMFLVLTATFRETSILDLRLPPAETATAMTREAPDVARIVVQADGGVVVEGQTVTLAGLGEVLARLLAAGTNAVVLSADARSSHGSVVAVLDRIRRAGISDTRLETRPEAGF